MFVDRNKSGEITARYSSSQYDGQEEIVDGSKEDKFITLSSKKLELINKIKEYYKSKEISLISYKEVKFICDKKAQDYIQDAIDFVQNSNCQEYKHYISYSDDNFIIFNLEELSELRVLIQKKRASLNFNENKHIELVNSILPKIKSNSKKDLVASEFDRCFSEIDSYDFKYYEDK